MLTDKERIEKVFSEKPFIIPTKKDNYALYEAGLFGNKAQTWSTYEEIVESGGMD